MKRALLSLSAAAGLAALIAVTSGAHNRGAPAASASVMARGRSMTMPSPTAASGPVSRQLHRRIVRVKIQNFAFLPARLVVSPGTRIVWTNTDSDPHTVTSDTRAGGLSSAALDTGGRYTAVLRRLGAITYHCTIHPYMHGSVLVAR